MVPPFCKSKRAAERVRDSITEFIEKKLHLKVNREKTVVSYVKGVKSLGYSFYVQNGKCQLTVHPKSKAKMKSRLKELTRRSNGWGYNKRKQKLAEYVYGCVGYYHLANMKRFLEETLHTAISNANLKLKGYPCLLDSYLEWHPK